MIRKTSLILVFLSLFWAWSSFAQPPVGDYNPVLSFDPEMNRFLAVYGHADETFETSIQGKFVNPDSSSGSAFEISTEGSGDISYNSLISSVFDPINRRFLVVFGQLDSSASTKDDIYAQFVNQNGTLQEVNFAVNEDDESQYYPRVAYDSVRERFLVVWADYRSPSNSEIYGQLLDKNGNKIGTSSPFNITNISGGQSPPSVIYIGAKESYFVIWVDDSSNIKGRLVDKDGNLDPSIIDISTNNSANPSLYINMAWDDIHNRLLVVWADRREGTRYDVYGQIIDFDSPSVSNFPIYSGVAGVYSLSPDVAFDSVNGRFLTGWLDNRNQLTIKYDNKKLLNPLVIINHDIFAKYVSYSGVPDSSDFPITEDADSHNTISLSFNSNCSNFMAGFTTETRDGTWLHSADFKLLGDACSNSPSAPELKSPENGATNVDSDVTLKWEKSTDPDGDDVSYDVLVCEDENFAGCEAVNVAFLAKQKEDYMFAGFGGLSAFVLMLLFLGLLKSPNKFRKPLMLLTLILVLFAGLTCSSKGLSYRAENLKSGTTYYWKVIASDGKGEISHSETWSFTTK